MLNQQVHTFMDGSTYYSLLDNIVRPKDGEIFKLGDMIIWEDPDVEIDSYDELNDEIKYKTPQFYTGQIESIFLIEESTDQYSVEISFDGPIGRVDLNEIERYD